ncbi:hypothetical protein AX17_004141 [Amanita inopinata Kibby_2008]|nr:hypothetical protein AX17_004141 [Amanita inopinata Kibby_2008]
MGDLAYADELRQTDLYRYMQYRLECERTLASTSQDETTSYFGSSAEADIILRSSDSVNFYVSRFLPRLMTPVFDSRISQNEENGNTKDGLVIIPMAEDSAKLRQLLLIVYHYADVPDARDALYSDMGIVTRKYNMQIIESQLRRQFLASHLVTEEPLRAYCIAVKSGWARLATADSLRTSLHNFAYIDISGADFCHFLKYRFRCVNAVEGIFKIVHERSLFNDGRIEYCGWPSGRTPPSGFSQFVASLQQVLKTEPRSISAVEDKNILTGPIKFPRDEVEMISKVLESRRVLLTAVEEAVSKVVLNFENESCETSDAASPS